MLKFLIHHSCMPLCDEIEYYIKIYISFFSISTFFCIHSCRTRASGSIFEGRSHAWLCKRSWKIQVHHFEGDREREMCNGFLEKNRRIECARLLPNDNCLVFRLQSICLEHKRRYKMFINRISNNKIAHFWVWLTWGGTQCDWLALLPPRWRRIALALSAFNTRNSMLLSNDFSFRPFFLLRWFANKSD